MNKRLIILLVLTLLSFALSSLAVSAVPPCSVTVTSPTSSSDWNGVHNVTWTTSNCPGNLSFDIKYKIGSGSLVSLATGLTSSPYSLDTTSLLDANNYKINVSETTNSKSDDSSTFTIDNTVPSTTNNIDGKWHTSNQAVSLSCSDGSSGSGCQTIYHTTDGSDPTNSSATGTSFTISTDGIYTIKYFAKDNAGNLESIKTALNQTKVDKTVPVTTDSIDANWHNTNPILSCSDATSGCLTTYYTTNGSNPSSSPTSTQGTNISLTDGIYTIKYRSKDIATNLESTKTAANQAKIDKTLPVILSNITSGILGNNGWYTTDVIVSFSCSDAGSGIASCNSPITLSNNGASQTATGTAVDNAGNNKQASSTVDIDKVKPSSSASSSAYDNSGNINVDFVSSDTTSDVASTRLWYSKDGAAWADSGLTLIGTSGTFTFTPSGDGTYDFYTISTDNAGNLEDAPVSADSTTVYDTTAPVISLTEINPQTLEVGNSYLELGATASDNSGDLTNSIVIDTSDIDMNTVGSYTVTYDVSDSSGNSAIQVTRTVNVVDTTAPVITLTGDDSIDVEYLSSYSDEGATASDNYDGDITSEISVGGDTVDTSTLGSYTVTYNVTDASGNVATQVTRTVNVVDTTAPVITLTGDDPITLEVNLDSYTEEGATASDNYDSDVTVSIGGDTVDTSVVDSYTVTYTATDSNGNSAEVTRTVNVVDTVNPTLTLTGSSPLIVGLNEVYVDAGATASDNYYGDITSDIVINNPVNTAVEGSYTVTYDVQDASGNAATQVSRTVNVGSSPIMFSDATLSFKTLPSGAFTIAAEQDDSTLLDVSSFRTTEKYFDITSDLTNGNFEVELTFNYNDIDQDSIVDNTAIQETDLNVYYYDITTSDWVMIPDPVRDTVANTLTVTSNHFTIFSLFGVAPASSPSAGNGGRGGGGGGAGGIEPRQTIAQQFPQNTPTGPTAAPVESVPTAIEAVPAEAPAAPGITGAAVAPPITGSSVLGNYVKTTGGKAAVALVVIALGALGIRIYRKRKNAI